MVFLGGGGNGETESQNEVRCETKGLKRIGVLESSHPTHVGDQGNLYLARMFVSILSNLSCLFSASSLLFVFLNV